MPFTLAHPAIVLPLARNSKNWFSLTALIVGSMTPDFEYFLRLRVKGVYGHTIAGIFWFDLPLGILIFIIYNSLVKQALIDNLPSFLNKRFSEYRYRSRVTLAILPVIIGSLIIGIVSHLLWDSFTHPNGYFVLNTPILNKQLAFGQHHVSLYKIIQHLSTIIGFVVISSIIIRLKLERETRTYYYSRFWIIVAIVALFLLSTKYLTGMELKDYGSEIVTFISGAWLGLVVAAFISLKVVKTPLSEVS